MIMTGSWDGEIILDYVGGPNVITRESRGRSDRRKEGSMMMAERLGCCGHNQGMPVVTRSSKKHRMNFLLELPEGTSPVDSLTLALWGSFWTSGLQNCKTTFSCCFRPLFVVIFYVNNRKLIYFSKQEEENQVKMSAQAKNGMRLTSRCIWLLSSHPS